MNQPFAAENMEYLCNGGTDYLALMESSFISSSSDNICEFEDQNDDINNIGQIITAENMGYFIQLQDFK